MKKSTPSFQTKHGKRTEKENERNESKEKSPRRILTKQPEIMYHYLTEII